MHRDGAVRQTPFLHFLGLQTLPHLTADSGGPGPSSEPAWERSQSPPLSQPLGALHTPRDPWTDPQAPGHLGKRKKRRGYPG